jgi:hypothetical protein
MIQGELFNQRKEFRIGVVIVVPPSPPRYPKPRIYINYYADFYYYWAIVRTEGDLFDYATPEQAEEVARKRAEIVVVTRNEDHATWERILATGGYRQVQGEVEATSYRLKVAVRYLLDSLGNIVPLHHKMEDPFYGPLVQLHYAQLAKEGSL